MRASSSFIRSNHMSGEALITVATSNDLLLLLLLCCGLLMSSPSGAVQPKVSEWLFQFCDHNHDCSRCQLQQLRHCRCFQAVARFNAVYKSCGWFNDVRLRYRAYSQFLLTCSKCYCDGNFSIAVNGLSSNIVGLFESAARQRQSDPDNYYSHDLPRHCAGLSFLLEY